MTDNGDIIQQREALLLVRNRLATVVEQLAVFAQKYAAMPCVGLTHLQPAQLTTVGKRVCLWLQDLVTDLHQTLLTIDELQILGVKGAVGSQDSFLNLFDGNAEKVHALESYVCKEFNFAKTFSITGQTYPVNRT